MAISTLEKIEKEAEKLNPQAQEKLLKWLSSNIQKNNKSSKKSLNWNNIYGIGKGLWNKDAQKYVNELRVNRI